MAINLTVILNVHNEDGYITRTLISIEEAAVFAFRLGIVLELIIVLDRPTQGVRQIVAKAAPAGFEKIRVIEVDNGSLGLSRNSGAAIASGDWLFLQDADDLISYNALAEFYFSAMRHGPRSLHICDTLIAFGLDPHVATYFDSDVVTPIAFLDAHPFVSRIFCPRSLLEQQPFIDLRLTRGYAYEDWFFNAEALAKGYTFHSVPHTIFFYRQRANGLLRQANTISARQIPPSKLFKPSKFLRLAAEGYSRYKQEPCWRDRLVHRQTDVNHPVVFDLIVAANRIEPQISWSEISKSPKYNNLSFGNVSVGIAYYEMCQLIGVKKFDDVFLLPFLGVGGAERYFLDLMHELTAAGSTRNSLVFLGQSGHPSNWLDRLPSNAIVIDFEVLCPQLDQSARILLTLKAIQASAGAARLHMKPSPYAHAFAQRYLHLLKECTRIYYRFTDARTFVHGQTIQDPYGFEFVSSHIEDIDVVVADNQLVIDEDRRRLGIYGERWHLLYARQIPKVDVGDVAQITAQAAPAIAWASRLDHQKRPELLPLIATRLRVRAPELVLHVFGKPVLNSFAGDTLAAHANVCMHGEFARFEEVLVVKPLCFLFTSFFEGVPIVLLEAAASALPIIAPCVGGVGEVVEDGETGALLQSLADDEAMADAIVEAILTYVERPSHREFVASNALARLMARNGAEAYSRRIIDIFLQENG